MRPACCTRAPAAVLGVNDTTGVRAAIGTLRQRFDAAFRGTVLQPMLPPGR
jgi:hypothetical protein